MMSFNDLSKKKQAADQAAADAKAPKPKADIEENQAAAPEPGVARKA